MKILTEQCHAEAQHLEHSEEAKEQSAGAAELGASGSREIVTLLQTV